MKLKLSAQWHQTACIEQKKKERLKEYATPHHYERRRVPHQWEEWDIKVGKGDVGGKDHQIKHHVILKPCFIGEEKG